MFTLTGISCKSAPPTVEATLVIPAEDPEEDAPRGSIQELTSRVEEARKRAIDFESPSYFPSEWEAVEARYAAIGEMPRTTPAEIQRLTTTLSVIAITYDDLFNKTIPLYAQAKEDAICAVRDSLINTGFTTAFPGYLRGADEIALAALEQYEARDYYTARDSAIAALNEYELLLIGARAFLARQEIIDRGFSGFDYENFTKADEVAQAAVVKFEAGDKKAAQESVEEALLRYNIVLKNGWVAFAAEKRSAAVTERELAITNRVNIAVRDGFREADVIFNQAVESFRTENFENAALFFIEAEARFAIAGQETYEKRQRALETIRLAEEKVEESIETAREAERLIEGGSR
jgi:hypothetical protein